MKGKYIYSFGFIFLLSYSFLPGQIKKIPQLQKPRIEKPVIRPLKPGWKAKMIAATVEGKVVLKWVIEDGWLPPRGFNLYRQRAGEEEYQKIAGPLLERELPAIKTVDLSGSEVFYNLREFQLLAKKVFRPERKACSSWPKKFPLLRPFSRIAGF